MAPTKTFLALPPSQDNSDKIHSRLVGNYSPNKIKDFDVKSGEFQPTFVMNKNSGVLYTAKPNRFDPSFQIHQIFQQPSTLGEGISDEDKVHQTESVEIGAFPREIDPSSVVNTKKAPKLDPFEIFGYTSQERPDHEVAPEISWPSKEFIHSQDSEKPPVKIETVKWNPKLNFGE